jgi:hypothetical protein
VLPNETFQGHLLISQHLYKRLSFAIDLDLSFSVKVTNGDIEFSAILREQFKMLTAMLTLALYVENELCTEL